jgi:hypothetical protein
MSASANPNGISAVSMPRNELKIHSRSVVYQYFTNRSGQHRLDGAFASARAILKAQTKYPHLAPASAG